MTSPTHPMRIDPVSISSVKLGQNRKTVADVYREKLAEARHAIEEDGVKLSALLALAAGDDPLPYYPAAHDLLCSIEQHRSTITWLEDALSYEDFPR